MTQHIIKHTHLFLDDFGRRLYKAPTLGAWQLLGRFEEVALALLCSAARGRIRVFLVLLRHKTLKKGFERV